MNFFKFYESILKCNGQINIIKFMHEFGKLPICRYHLTLKGLNFDIDEKHE